MGFLGGELARIIGQARSPTAIHQSPHMRRAKTQSVYTKGHKEIPIQSHKKGIRDWAK